MNQNWNVPENVNGFFLYFEFSYRCYVHRKCTIQQPDTQREGERMRKKKHKTDTIFEFDKQWDCVQIYRKTLITTRLFDCLPTASQTYDRRYRNEYVCAIAQKFNGLNKKQLTTFMSLAKGKIMRHKRNQDIFRTNQINGNMQKKKPNLIHSILMFVATIEINTKSSTVCEYGNNRPYIKCYRLLRPHFNSMCSPRKKKHIPTATHVKLHRKMCIKMFVR